MKRVKRFAALLLALALALGVGGGAPGTAGLLSLKAQAAEGSKTNTGGIIDGFPESVDSSFFTGVTEICIYNAYDWNTAARWCLDIAYVGVTVKLMNDVTLSGGIYSFDDFKGTFDGQDHILTVADDSYFALPDVSGRAFGPDLGLFSNLMGSAAVENLAVWLEGDLFVSETAMNKDSADGAGVTDGSVYNFGTLVGNMSDSSAVNNCAVLSAPGTSGALVYSRNYSPASVSMGGIVGYMAGTASVDGCYVGVNLDGYVGQIAAIRVAGIAGYMDGTGTIENCVVDGSAMYAYNYNPFLIALGSAYNNIYPCCTGGLVGGMSAAGSQSVRCCVVRDSSGRTRALSAPDGGRGALYGASYGTVGALFAESASGSYSTLYSSYAQSGYSLNGAYATGSADQASAALLNGSGGSAWTDAKSGLANLEWLVTSGPAITVEKSSTDATITFTPAFLDTNDDGLFDSGSTGNASEKYDYKAEFSVQGSMATPTGASVSKQTTGATVSAVTVAQQTDASDPTAGIYLSGGHYRFKATVTGTSVTTDRPEITWSTGLVSGQGTASIDEDGLLILSDNCTGTVYVQATCSGVKSAKKNLTVVSGLVTIEGDASVSKGSITAYRAVVYGNQAFLQNATNATWTLTSSLNSGVSLSSDGILTVDKDSTAATASIRVSVNGILSAIKNVTLTDWATADDTASLSISEGTGGAVTAAVSGDAGFATLLANQKLIVSGSTTPLVTVQNIAATETTGAQTITKTYTFSSATCTADTALTAAGTCSVSSGSAVFTAKAGPFAADAAGVLTVTGRYSTSTVTMTESLEPEGTPTTDTVTGTADLTATVSVTVKKNAVTAGSIISNNLPAAPDAPGDTYTDTGTTPSRYLFTISPAETTTTQYMMAFSTQSDADGVPETAWEEYPAGGLSTEKRTVTSGSSTVDATYLWLYTQSDSSGTYGPSGKLRYTIDWATPALTGLSGTVSSGTANATVTKTGTVDGSEMVNKTYSVNSDLLSGGSRIGTGNITVTAWPEASRFHGADTDFIINSSAVDTMGALTAKPTFTPASGTAINPEVGIVINVPAGTTVYYTLTPDTTGSTAITGAADPQLDETTGEVVSGSRTKIYQAGDRIDYPSGYDKFVIKAVAWKSGYRTSDIVTATYTTDNLPSPEMPTLLLGSSKMAYSSTATYAEGSEIHFSHDEMAAGTIYFTTNGANPQIYKADEYDPLSETPATLPTGKTSVTIKAIYYETSSGLSSAIAEFIVNIRQKIDTPVALSGPAVNLAPGSLIRPSEELYFSLSDAAIAQLNAVGYQVARLQYSTDLNPDAGMTVTGSPKEGEEYISCEVSSDSTFTLPEIRYLINPADTLSVASNGILYPYSTRMVTSSVTVNETTNEIVTTRAVTYENASPVYLTGVSGDTVNVKAMTLYMGDEYDDSAVSAFSYTIRGPVADPVAFPKTEKDSPATVKVGDRIALSTDTADTEIYYTTDGSKPMVTYLGLDDANNYNTVTGTDGNLYTHQPANSSTKRYYDTQSIQILTDELYIYTVNAVAVSKYDTLENSSIVTIRYQVDPLTLAETPTAVPPTSASSFTELANDSTIMLASGSLNTTIYYTTDGTVPDIDAREAWDKTEAQYPGTILTGSNGRRYYTDVDEDNNPVNVYEPLSTKIYSEQSAVLMKATSESPLFTIVAIAKEMSTPPKLAESLPVRLTYRLAKAAAPIATPGTSNDQITTIRPNSVVNLSTTTANASVYYTTDNSMPDPDGYDAWVSGGSLTETDSSGTVLHYYLSGGQKVYVSTMRYDTTKGITMPSTVETFFTVRAVTRANTTSESYALYDDSDVVQYTYQPPAPVQAVFASPSTADGVPVVRNQKVVLKCSTAGAVIFYRTYTSAPVDDDIPEPYVDQIFSEDEPIVISKNLWIRAIAEREGVVSKSATTYYYQVAPDLSTPTASLESGSIAAKGASIGIKSTTGSTIIYTIDGSDPSDPENTARLYGGTVVLDADYGKSMTIRAYAVRDGYTPSAVATFIYSICEKEEYIQATPESGSEVSPGSTISLTTPLTDALIYYTTNGTSPDEDSKEGNRVLVTGNPGAAFTVKAVAIADGTEGSPTYVFTYRLRNQTSAPTASIPNGAIVLSGATVTLTAKEGDIFFTTDGSDPTTSSRLYVNPIEINGSMVLKAIAVAKDAEPSQIVQYSYTFAGQAAAPVMSESSGQVEQGARISLSTATPDAVIYYSTNGADPTSGSTVYSGPITIMRPVTIKAIAAKKGLHDSVVNSATYTVIEPKPPAEETDSQSLPKVTQTDRLTSRRTYSESALGPTYTDVVITNPEYNAVVASEKDVVEPDAKLIIRQIDYSDSDQKAVDRLLGYDIVSLYDITLEHGGVAVQPSGQIELGIPIPAGYQNGIVVVCRINDDGTVDAFPTRRSGQMAYVLVEHFSKYAITVPEKSAGVSSDMGMLLIAGAAGAAALAILGTGVAVWRRRRKKRRS